MPPPPPAPAARLWGALLDLVYPRRCGGCSALGAWLCPACLAAIVPPPAAGWTCAVCTRPLGPSPGGAACPAACSPSDLTAVLCTGTYAGPLAAAIRRLKYNGWRVLGDPLGGLLEATCVGQPLPWGDGVAPALLPVPLHPRRARRRGFNQSAVLARRLGAGLGWPVVRGLARVRDTPQQVGLAAADRSANLDDAFAWTAASSPPPGPCLLIDDVYTTGATLYSCAEVLRGAGSGPVYGLVLARRAVDQDAAGGDGPVP